MTFALSYDPGRAPEANDWVIAVHEQKLLVKQNAQGLLESAAHFDALKTQTQHFLGFWCDHPCFLFVVDVYEKNTLEEKGFEETHLRHYLDTLNPQEFFLAGRALQLAYWLEQHRFCGRCGHANRLHDDERVMLCPNCENTAYPRISPCVIGLVHKGDTCLLAHNARFPEGRYSVLAGFVEPGESAEEALAREVKEETNIDIKNIRYVSSQPWPFPSQLMLGFVAEYAGGTIEVDGIEITDAGWYSADALPQLPPAGTISGELIDLFVQGLVDT